jgi:trans-aconitate 2-methyltransferase
LTVVWDPAQYERYKAYRDRPALDLLVQLPADLDPAEIWDLGCGTGEHAALLKRRHPAAHVHGLDLSAEMLAEARARPDDVEWVQGSVQDWAPAAASDLIFSNAALQWLGGHRELFPQLVGRIASGGVFACQMPLSYQSPWYDLLRETALLPEWRERLSGVRAVQPVETPETYYDLLAPLCGSVDIWTTTYLHALEGEDPVVDWMKGTGLRPFLQALSSDLERERFLEAYRARISPVFPRRPDGKTLFPFPRLFVLARRA